MVYQNLSTRQIIAGIKEILGGLLNDSIDKACKLVVLESVLEDQNVESIDNENFHILLKYIEEKILPYINEYSNEGQDILSYFFTTFNKYVSRDDIIVLPQSYIKGDINGDGCVNNKDATQILRYFANWNLTELVEEALDTNGDGVISNKDATHLLRYFANWNVELH